MDGFTTCTTDQLSLNDRHSILDLFSQIYHIEKSYEHFEREFLNTCKGHSYHCIYKKSDRVLASFCIIPYEYSINGEKTLFGLSVDTIVSRDAQLGPFGVADMAEMTEKLAKEDGCTVLYGFPNDNFHTYNIEILNRSEIGILDFYLIPLAPGKIKKYLSVFNFVRFTSSFFLLLCRSFASSRILSYPVEKVDSEIFRKGRYDQQHHVVRFSGGEVIYTLYEETFGTIAYIIDITPVSGKNFYSAFLAVASEVKGNAGMIAYPCGRLPFGNLMRLPRKFLPRKLHLVAAGMAGGPLPEACAKMQNWKINLSDFDVR